MRNFQFLDDAKESVTMLLLERSRCSDGAASTFLGINFQYAKEKFLHYCYRIIERCYDNHTR